MHRLLTILRLIFAIPLLTHGTDSKCTNEEVINLTQKIKPSPMQISPYHMLKQCKAVNNADDGVPEKSIKTVAKKKINREEKEGLLAEKFWSIASDHFSKQKNLEPTNELAAAETIDTTIELLMTFHTQLRTKEEDLSLLHEALTQLSPEKKLSALLFANDLGASSRFLNILAHSVKDDFLTLPKLRTKLKPKIADCPYTLTQTIWKKIGIYEGSQKTERQTLFPKPGIIQIPRKKELQTIDLETGKILEETEQNSFDMPPEKKLDEQEVLDALPWDTYNENTQQIRRGNYVIELSKSNYFNQEKKAIDNNSLSEHICLTKKFFAQINSYNAARREQGEDMEGYFIDFEHNCDGRLNVHCSWEQNRGIGWDDLDYPETKMRSAGDVIFAKGWNKIDAFDTATGIHTIFESDYTIDDVFVSPDGKYIAICEDGELLHTSCSSGSSSYIYHVFALSPSDLPLRVFIKKMLKAPTVQTAKYPPADFYGSCYGVVTKALAWLALQCLKGLTIASHLFQ